MPRRLVWIEKVFSYFPVNKEILVHQMMTRLGILLLIWVTGLVAHAEDGLLMSYVTDLQVYQGLAISFIILFGSYMIQDSLSETILSFRPLLRMSNTSFRRFAERVERYSSSVVPCLLIAGVFTLFYSSIPSEVQMALVDGFRLHVVWRLFFIFVINLLTATGIWFGVSIWLTIFLVSRQPLKVELSSATVDRFRGLTMLALWVSLFYFVSLAIAVAITLIGSPTVSLFEIIVSPFIVFIGIGIVSVLFPFYNIHKTFLRFKKQELSGIEQELEQLQQQLDTVLTRSAMPSSDEVIGIMGRLFSLQIKERKVKAAPEWPIDISFLIKLVGLILLPAISRILIEIFNRFYL